MTASSYSDIVGRLDLVRQRDLRLRLAYGAMAALTAAAGLLLLVVSLERWFMFGTAGRTVLAAVGVLGICAAAARFLGRPLLVLAGLRAPDDRHALARKVGDHFPAIRDRLIDAIELYEQKDALGTFYSTDLIDASFADLYRDIAPLEFTEAVSAANVRRMRNGALYALAVAVLIVGVAPAGFFASFYRVVNFGRTFAAPPPVTFYIDPGNVEVVRGQTVPISVRTEGKPVRELVLYTRPHGQTTFDRQVLQPSGINRFRTELPSIKISTEYYAGTEDLTSTRYTISVLDRPIIRALHVTVAAPSYTRIPPKTLDENIGEITAYPGSMIEVSLLSGKPLGSAELVFRDSSRILMRVDGQRASGSFRVKSPGSYHIGLRDSDGLTNADPVEYPITVVADQPPTVEILSPARNIDLTGDQQLDLGIRISDDFGFSKLRLAYRLIQSKYEKPALTDTYIDIPIPPGTKSQADLGYRWLLAPLSLVPEDALAYYVEVFDNDVISGPKAARTESFVVRLPSLEEVFSDVDKAHDQSVDAMNNIAEDAARLKEEMEKFSREMKTNRDKADWQQQQKAAEMAKKFEEMRKKLDETTRKMDDMVQQMDQNRLLSPETMQKYQELQQMMQQLSSPELREMLRRMQESLPQLTPEQMKQAMNQVKMSEDQFRQNLERAIELLKRIHIEQKLDELVKRAQDLQRQQNALRKQGESANPSDKSKLNELSAKQDDLRRQTDSLQKESSDLSSRMEEFPKEMPTEEMNSANRQLQQKQIGKRMQQARQQMRSGDMKSAAQNQEQSEQDLGEFAQNMQKAQDALRQRQMQQIANAMRKQLQNLLELSKRQEQLKDETAGLDPNSQQFRDKSEEQSDALSDLGKVADQMGEIGKKSFAISPQMAQEIGKSMNQMSQALQQMEGRNPGASARSQSEAMSSLNNAAMMMQSALSSMMNGQGGMGMAGLMGRLQQMAGSQEGINSATRQAMGQGMSPEQQAEYQRLGTQQAAVQKSLKQLAEESKASGEYSRLMGDIDKIAQEMKEVQTDLEQGQVNPNTVQKQDRILSRLLESTRSMRERDYEKKRKAESGKDIFRQSPGQIDLSTQEGINRLREEFLKIPGGKFTKDYEALIRKYFEELEKEHIRQ